MVLEDSIQLGKVGADVEVVFEPVGAELDEGAVGELLAGVELAEESGGGELRDDLAQSQLLLGLLVLDYGDFAAPVELGDEPPHQSVLPLQPALVLRFR